jgi:hypothetical protein
MIKTLILSSYNLFGLDKNTIKRLKNKFCFQNDSYFLFLAVLGLLCIKVNHLYY